MAAVGGRDVGFCGASPYVDPQILDGNTLPLMRLRYGGSAASWGFAIHLPGKDRYQDAILPTGGFAGLPEDALVAYYTFVLFITTCVATYFKLPRSYARMAVLIAVCQLFLVAWFGRLSDRFGRRPLCLFGAIGAANSVFVFLVLPHTASFSLIVLGVLITLFFQAAYGSQAAFVVGRFPTKIRCGGAPMGFQLAGIFGHSPAQIIWVAMLERHDISFVVSLYVMVVLAVTAACVLVAAETSRVDKDADLVDQRAGERCPR